MMISIEHSGNLRSLQLRGLRLQDRGAKALAALKETRLLHTPNLDLKANGVGESGASVDLLIPSLSVDQRWWRSFNPFGSSLLWGP